MSGLRVFYPAGREVERLYTLDVVLRHFLGQDFTAEVHAEPWTTIAAADGGQELTIDDGLFAMPDAAWLKPASLPARPVREATVPEELRAANSIAPHRTFMLYGPPDARIFERTTGGARISFDLLGSIFFLLTRYEEIVMTDRDQWGRFPAVAAVAVAGGFAERPVVNEWLEVLWAALVTLWPQAVRKTWSYALVLSHDVDEVSIQGRALTAVAHTVAADVLLRREPAAALLKASAWVQSLLTKSPAAYDPYDSFDFIMTLSEKHGLKSAFYLIPGNTSTYDARYTLEDAWIRALMRRINERGHEIGYHGSFNTYLDLARTRSEVDYLRRVCEQEGIRAQVTGGRQHYLRWQNPETWNNWEFSGLTYDSTLAFAEHAGFRAGTCWSYPAIDLVARTRLKLIERPLVAMEASLFKYQSMSLAEAEAKLRALSDVCRRYNGEFTLLWHNSTLTSKASRAVYARVVDYAA
jgi:hypothetical protein